MSRDFGCPSGVHFGLIWLLLASCSATLFADRILLKNGATLEGRVQPRADSFELFTSMGSMRIPREIVASVEVGESTEGRIAARLSTRGSVSADELFDLALEARSAGAMTLSRRLLMRLVALQPDHEQARRLLGFRRFGGRWLSEEEWRRARGEVLFHGRWMLPEDRSELIREESIRARLAWQRLAERERLLWEQQQREAEHASGGIPLSFVWSGSSGVVIPPAFVPLPPPAGALQPVPAPRRSTPDAPSLPRGRSLRGGFVPGSTPP